MYRPGVKAALAAAWGVGIVLLAAAPLCAQQRSKLPALQQDPNLNAEDQLAPSQITQPMPAAVPLPGGAPPSRPPSPHPTTGAAVSHGGGPAGKPSRAVHTVVACNGPFAKDSSMLGLAMAFDSRNLTYTDVNVAGSTVGATVIFPKEPKRRLEVWWANPGNRSGTYLILINGQSTWTGPGGVRLGLSLDQLTKLNHKAFKLKGFNKDNVATVTDWDGGALAALPGGCKAGLSLKADSKASPDAVSALSADTEYNSADAAIRAVKPAVSEISDRLLTALADGSADPDQLTNVSD